MYEIGDKVIFIENLEKEHSWKLDNYELYTISRIAYDPYNKYQKIYGVRDYQGYTITWFDEDDFITLTEYRKLKLNKLKDGCE